MVSMDQIYLIQVSLPMALDNDRATFSMLFKALLLYLNFFNFLYQFKAQTDFFII